MPDLTILSLGAGVQSSALLVLSALGLRDCPRADVAVFADTQCEPPWVYEQLEVLSAWSGARGVPVVTVTAGNLQEEGHGSFTTVPFWTLGEDGRAAPLHRQCTAGFKLTPIQKEIRRLLGYQPRQRVKKQACVLIGISVDECARMKPSRVPWITNTYPLVDANMSRAGCEEILRVVGLPIPQKSACRFCPYHSDDYWEWLKQERPADFEHACRDDEGFRHAARGTRPAYVHRSLTPLREAEFRPRSKVVERSLWDSFTEECEGMCGV